MIKKIKEIWRNFWLWQSKKNEIMQACQILLNENKELILTSDTILYRAKYGTRDEIIPGGPAGFSRPSPLEEQNLWNSSGQQGRFNPIKIYHPYLGFDELTAVAEIRPLFGSYISLGVYKPRRDIKVFDATRVIADNFLLGSPQEFITSMFSSPESGKGSIYKACNSCAALFQKSKYEGIVWNSSRRYGGKCLVLFNEKNKQLFQKVNELLVLDQTYWGQVLNSDCDCCISNFKFVSSRIRF